ncbi:tetratricopeptide repeat protein [Planctellipticum variicoloris]|uniref:tetratricopeptide repeat protein n=1 Tax=Planctellipticum variicoloris TaxID=3064265 RepID=UPI0030137611|nr:hypothetical protein SH412_004558 [Planctomycetaceae bacterium SH412]
MRLSYGCAPWVVLGILGFANLASAQAPAGTAPADPAAEETQRRAAAVALNYSRASMHRIRRNPSVRVLTEEQDKILNHLNLNGVADPEVVQLYSSVLDEVSQVQLAESEKLILQEKYRHSFNAGLTANAFTLAAQVATANYPAAVRTGANSWWDYRTMGVNRDLDIWRVDKSRYQSIVTKSNQFLDVSWKMARNRQIPDRWLVRGDDLDKLELACHENDSEVRLRVLKRMEPFMECYPPYWYYVARTQQSMGQLFAAGETYDQLAKLGSGHFRKDEMLACGLANRAMIQAYLHQPGAAETAKLALSHSTDVWEANLVCASVLLQYKQGHDAEDAVLRNLDGNLERGQSQLALVSVYYETGDTQKLAARLSDPAVVRELPASALLACAARLGEGQVPQSLVMHLQNSLQAAPRVQFGPDDFVLAAAPHWNLQQARIKLHYGDQTFEQPRFANGREGLMVSFDGVAEMGGPLNSSPDDREVAVTVAYPNQEPVKLVLRPGRVAAAPVGVARTSVYRLTSFEQGKTLVSLIPGVTLPTTSPDSTLAGTKSPAPSALPAATPGEMPTGTSALPASTTIDATIRGVTPVSPATSTTGTSGSTPPAPTVELQFPE